MNRRRDIQGLRAVAVGLVVAAHAGVPGVQGGFIGVDVFFVISGFLITGLLLSEGRRTDRIRLRDFYARRARRILPAATLVLVVTLAYVSFVGSLARTDQTRADALWSAGFLANVHFARTGADYFSTDLPSAFQHYWSLAVEEQFYLVWPLVIALLVRRRASRGLVLAVTGTLVLASLAWSLRVTDLHPSAAYFSTPARGYELGAGALLAVLAPRIPRAAQALLGVTGVVVLGWAAATMSGETPFPGWQAAVPVVGTVALLAARRGPVAAVLSWAPLRWLGDISFSVYLWHWPILVLGASRLPQDWGQADRTSLLLVVTLAASVLSYLLVERTFQRGLPALRGPRGLVLWPATLAVVVASSIAATTHSQAVMAHQRDVADSWFEAHPEATAPPAPTDIPDALARAVALARSGAPLPSVDLGEHAKDVWRTDFGCYADFDATTTRLCTYGDPTAGPLVVVYGDSHAGMWLPALDSIGKSAHFRVVPLVKSSCMPFDVPQSLGQHDYQGCDAFHRWALGQMRRLRPAAVVVSYRGLYQTRALPGMTRGRTWQQGVATTARELTAITRDVVVVGDIPQRALPAPECLSTPGADQATCLAPVAGDGIVANDFTVRGIAGTGARFVDPRALVCSAGVCPLVVGDDVVFYDDDHITASWSRLVAPALEKLLGPLVGATPTA
ncbi:SGNH hydrolase domain-containing protein [Nocardioides panacihumi]|uniref:SGNH hydrolase domain-containing protein n=1 Tax=Nocardioides panacihumi TaxID=400774 RepID=A0ABN2Q666_9ACTN